MFSPVTKWHLFVPFRCWVQSPMVERLGVELSCFRWTSMLLLTPSKSEALGKQVKRRKTEKSVYVFVATASMEGTFPLFLPGSVV